MKRINMAPVHRRISCCQWRGSHPLGDPQEDHVRPAPQTPPLRWAHPLPGTGHSEPPSAGSFHRVAPLLQGHRCAIQSSPVLGCPHPQHPSPPPHHGLHLQEPFIKEIRVGAPRRKALIPQG